MEQLNIWNEKYFNNFIDESQKFNKIGNTYVKKEMWEVTEDNLAFNYLGRSEKRKELELLSLEIGLPKKHSETLIKIADRKDLIYETFLALDFFKENYQEIIGQHKTMVNDPVSFYQKNKKIKNLENDVLTFGTLSLSYSFCSPYRLISTMIYDAQTIGGYHEYMIECCDENHKLEDFDGFILNTGKNDFMIEQQAKSLAQDLRGNKVPQDLLEELFDKIKFEKRDAEDYYFGRVVISKKTLIDSFYVFFGSKLGSDFVEKWKNGEDKQILKQEFENHIYENPYVNLGLINMDMKKFGTDEHLENAENFLKWKKINPRRNIELDFGLQL